MAAIDKLAHFAEHFGEDAARDDEFAGGVMLRNGIPEEIVRALQTGLVGVPRVGLEGEGHAAAARRRDAGAARPRAAGAAPAGPLALRTPSSGTRSGGILIAADHLIKHISSNPLISRPLDDREAADPAQRPQALVTYLESLRQTREMPAEIVLSGHGEPITDHVALIDERFEFHRRRADKIYGLIAERPRTGYDLTQALFGDIAVTQAYLTLSEVLGPRRPAAERGPGARGRAGRRRAFRGDLSDRYLFRSLV